MPLDVERAYPNSMSGSSPSIPAFSSWPGPLRAPLLLTRPLFQPPSPSRPASYHPRSRSWLWTCAAACPLRQCPRLGRQLRQSLQSRSVCCPVQSFQDMCLLNQWGRKGTLFVPLCSTNSLQPAVMWCLPDSSQLPIVQAWAIFRVGLD